MVRSRRGQGGIFNTLAGETSRKFMKFLHDNKHPDIFRRDDLRVIYEKQFTEFCRASENEFEKVKFRDVLLHLRKGKFMHELGDFYAFGDDVQGLYTSLMSSDEHQKTLEEWKEKAKLHRYFCAYCGVNCQTEKSLEQHKNGARHRIHKFHYEINRNREQLAHCPSGIEIISEPPGNANSMIEKECGPKEKLYMYLAIKNTNKEDTLILRRHLLLWDTGVFVLLQKDKRPARPHVHIGPGGSYEMLVNCKAPEDFGHHFVPIALFFEWKDRHGQMIAADEQTQEFVVRFVSLHVLGDLHAVMAPTAPFKYPEQIPESQVDAVVPGVECPKSGKSLLQCKLTPCRVPMYLRPQVEKGLTGKKEVINISLRKVLQDDLEKNYQKKFDTLLWTEEIQMEQDIKRYDMVNVEMTLDQPSGLMVLDVPGLMERRPSILKGDKVFIFADGNRTIRYEAFVHRVELENVHLGVGRRLKDGWVRGMRFDIRFDFLKFNLWLQHRSVADFKNAEIILFPSSETTVPPREEQVPMKPWYDRSLNPEQQLAVTNIVQGTSRPAPYLIFGPPGTGKTVTVTEAIRQVYHCQPDAKILVCCPENTAADFIMKKLINTSQAGAVTKADIFRMYAVSRPYISVPPDIKESGQFNYDDVEKEFFYPGKAELKKFKILIVTLSNSGRLVSADFPRNFYTHVFIDEGAHAIEPECIIPITGLVDARTGDCGQLVIAGDPRQLGPIIRSPFAVNHGLETSLLERLMDTIPQYTRSEESGYDPRYITKLVRNYRSHDAIITVSRKLFYDGILEACGDPMILNSMLKWEHLPNMMFPVIFHAVFGNDEREAESPSFFNRDELSQVQKYLDLLLKEKKGGLKIKPTDIGIISPYRKQVEKIRQLVQRKNYGSRGQIMVGSVEEFQGQERKIILISTVRSSDCYIEKDLDYHLGFLRNPKRFNVALTRARSLLIVIGNPMILEQDPIWKEFLNYCDANGGFRGQHGKLRPADRGANTDNDTSGNIEIIYNRLASLRLQSEDPEWQIRN